MLRHYKGEQSRPIGSLSSENLDHEPVHGLSRFADLPQRLGAVSALACARATLLPHAYQRLSGRDARPIRARLLSTQRAGSSERSGHEASELANALEK